MIVLLNPLLPPHPPFLPTNPPACRVYPKIHPAIPSKPEMSDNPIIQSQNETPDNPYNYPLSHP